MDFIHYKEAWDLLKSTIPPAGQLEKKLSDCLGYYTSCDVFAPLDYPLFDNSAMDGFGFQYNKLTIGKFYPIHGEIKAGSSIFPDNIPNHATQIYTGAPVPDWMDVVVPKEQCIKEGNLIKVFSGPVTQGMNIRKMGSQTKEGQLILPAFTKITSGIIGFLATFGIDTLSVFTWPQVGVIVTGDELISPGNEPGLGQVFESNSFALQAMLQENNIKPAFLKRVGDSLEKLSDAMLDALNNCDILLVTGGISVGDYDFVQEALHANGVEKLFYKIRQKPGKPIYVGTRGKVTVFALPGNPASVFTCFEVYVKPFIRAYISGGKEFVQLETGKMSHDFFKKKGLTHFLKSTIDSGDVTILDGQESYKMLGFVIANALAIVEEDVENIKTGDPVLYIKL